MSYDSYRPNTSNMEEKRSTAPLKILLEGQPKETCPMLNQEQQAKLPPKIRQVLSREGVREDLGDMGIVVRVRDTQYHMALKRALQWLAMGSAAAFLETRKLDVIKKEGDRKFCWSADCDLCDSMLTCDCFLNRENYHVRAENSRRQCWIHRNQYDALMLCRRDRRLQIQYRVWAR